MTCLAQVFRYHIKMLFTDVVTQRVKTKALQGKKRSHNHEHNRYLRVSAMVIEGFPHTPRRKQLAPEGPTRIP